MNLGFIGTGVITEAIVTGLLCADFPVSEIIVSSRGRETSGKLAAKYSRVRIFEDNQEIVETSDVIFLAIRPQVAEAVLSPLIFPAGKQIASLIATLPAEKLREWIGPSAEITRAIPLPSVAYRSGVTAVYPRSELLTDLFSALGIVVTAKTIDEFNAYAVASALMGTYFGVLETTAQWMCGQGTDYNDARVYLASLFLGLATTSTQAEGQDFEDLRFGHSTPGGLNQQLFDVFTADGGLRALTNGLASVSERVQQSFQAT